MECRSWSISRTRTKLDNRFSWVDPALWDIGVTAPAGIGDGAYATLPTPVFGRPARHQLA